MSTTALVRSPSSTITRTASSSSSLASPSQQLRRPSPTSTTLLPNVKPVGTPTPQPQSGTPATKTPTQQPSPAISTPGRWQHPRMEEIIQRQNRTNFDNTSMRTILWNVAFLLLSLFLPSTLRTWYVLLARGLPFVANLESIILGSRTRCCRVSHHTQRTHAGPFKRSVSSTSPSRVCLCSERQIPAKTFRSHQRNVNSSACHRYRDQQRHRRKSSGSRHLATRVPPPTHLAAVPLACAPKSVARRYRRCPRPQWVDTGAAAGDRVARLSRLAEMRGDD